MAKNSAHKKAARAYQQEHPGTTFHDAMRAVDTRKSETPDAVDHSPEIAGSALDMLGSGAAPALPPEDSASKPSIVSDEVWFAAALRGSDAVFRKALLDGRSTMPLELRIIPVVQTMADAVFKDLDRGTRKGPEKP